LVKALLEPGADVVDAEVVSFYKRQGWILEPRGSKCAFWYAN